VSKRGKIDIGGLSPRTADPAPEEAAPVPQPSPEPHPKDQTRGSKESAGATYERPSRRPRTERENAFDVTSWLLEGVVGIAEELRHNDLGLPEEFWTHAYTARKEALLAARTLLDVAIERCDETALPTSRRRQRKQRGNVNIHFK
jgi:hypothetical protein